MTPGRYFYVFFFWGAMVHSQIPKTPLEGANSKRCGEPVWLDGVDSRPILPPMGSEPEPNPCSAEDVQDVKDVEHVENVENVEDDVLHDSEDPITPNSSAGNFVASVSKEKVKTFL